METLSKSKDTFFSNFNKICRTCIKTITEPLHQIFESEVVVLNESIKTCELLIAVSTLKMHPDDDLPKAICLQCLDSLTKAYNFQKMCILSDLCMRSAILPPELQITLQKTSLTNSDVVSKKQEDIFFETCIQNLINPIENPNSFKILYSEPMNTDIENIGASEESIVSKPIMQQSDVLSSQDINNMKFLFLPAESELIHHSGTNMIIPSEINTSMNVFTPLTSTIANVDHLGTSIVIPSDISEVMLLEQQMQKTLITNDPQLDFTNVSLSEVPPWKKGTKFQSVNQDICVQTVLIPSENENIFPTNSLLTSHINNLNMANISETCKQSTTTPIEKKNTNNRLPIEMSLTVSEPNQIFNEAVEQKEDGKIILKTDSRSCSKSLPAKTLPPEDEIVIFHQTTSSRTVPTSEYDENSDNEKPNVPGRLRADSDSIEHNINQSEPINVVKVKTIGPTSTEDADNHEDEGTKTLVDVDVEDLIQTNIVDSKAKKKEEPIYSTSEESEESGSECSDQNIIKENIDNEMENPDDPVVQEIEKPNPRNKQIICFTCETCGKSFSREYRLHRHMKLHKVEGQPFECEHCRRRFPLDGLLQRHLITHEKIFLDIVEAKQNNEKKVDAYQCPKCPRKFQKHESRASHMRIHEKEMNKQFTCDICSKIFETLYRLTRHKRLHQENRRFKCDICGKTFDLSSQLVDHLNMHNGRKPHVCDHCQKSFTQACTLREHIRLHTGEQNFLCSECGKTFNSASNLRQHLMRHTGVKQFQCSECPSKFTCKSGLFSHRTIHRTQKPYECSTCGSRFTKSFSLKKHERIHTGERPFKCEQCEMRFNSADHAKRHMRTHTGEKPYKCNYCEKKFAQSNDRIKHLRSHLGENVYKCDECGASFRLNTELKKHISEHFQSQVKDKTKKKI